MNNSENPKFPFDASTLREKIRRRFFGLNVGDVESLADFVDRSNALRTNVENSVNGIISR